MLSRWGDMLRVTLGTLAVLGGVMAVSQVALGKSFVWCCSK